MGVSTETPPQAGKKRLLGCAAGCLGFVVVCVICLGIAVHFAVRAVPILPPETFVTPEADAFVVGKIDPGDVALLALIQDMMEGAQTGPGVFWRFGGKDGNLRQSISGVGMLQMVALVSYGSEKEREMSYSFVFSIQKMSGLMRWTFSRSLKELLRQGGVLTRHGKVTIGTGPGGWSRTVWRNNFMIAEDIEVIKEWIDRIEKQEEAGAGASAALAVGETLKAAYERLPCEAALRFASINTGGEVGLLLPEEGEFSQALKDMGLVGREVKALGMSLDVGDAQEAQVKVCASCGEEGQARQLAARLEGRGAAMEQQFQLARWKVSRDGKVVKLAFAVPHLWKKSQAVRKPGLDSKMALGYNLDKSDTFTRHVTWPRL